jgi:hypothetical protein
MNRATNKANRKKNHTGSSVCGAELSMTTGMPFLSPFLVIIAESCWMMTEQRALWWVWGRPAHLHI